MYGVELYSKVRMAVLRDGLSQREAARRFGVDRGTVAKMLEHSVPTGYRQTKALRRPKLDAHTAFIDEILRSDPSAPKKQRHTIKRIFLSVYATSAVSTAGTRRFATMSGLDGCR